MKSRMKTNNVLRFDNNLFLGTKLGLSTNWDYKSNIESIRQKK